MIKDKVKNRDIQNIDDDIIRAKRIIRQKLCEDEDIIAALDSVSPATYVTSATVPTIIAHGNADDIVPYSNAVTLDNALTAAGVEHTFITYKNTGHGLDNDSSAASLYEATLIDYANRYLK